MERISSASKRQLEDLIIPFWKGLIDKEYGGYYGYLSYDLELDKKAEKGCILNSRILWFFSEAAMLLERDDLKECADHAYDFLDKYCIDRENGGIFWSMSFDGKPLDTTKHTYNQAFAIYALSSYYRLTGNEDALKQAYDLFKIIEEKCTDDIGYLEAFTSDWGPESNEKLSENGVMADKTMNTLLHVFEGYSGLYTATKDPKIARAMEHILNIYTEKVFDPALCRQKVFFDAYYNSIIDLTSYGHDIESSWLIDWGTDLLKNDELSEKVSLINKKIAKKIYETAYYNNSLANECECGKVDTKRIWWVQAEAVLGFVNLWSKEPESIEYRDAAANNFNFILESITDKREGSEWFWCVDENGKAIEGEPIVEPWKCPYHNGRMFMELIRKDPDIYV